MPIIDTTCFKLSYREARSGLMDRLDRLPPQLVQTHQSWKHPLKGPHHEDLELDWFFLSQHTTPANVLILISATHGTEGFTGSAIQSYIVEELADLLTENSDLGVILIHALNPWGFAWIRRYDHEGIDINRNFIDFDADPMADENYKELHEALFKLPYNNISEVIKHYQQTWGEDTFTEIITRGQYQTPGGLFFGGTNKSWSRMVLEEACQTSVLSDAKQIAIIDLHTGLGPYGYGEVINDHTPATPGFDFAKQWYGANAQSPLLGESYSAPKTGLLDYHWHSLLDNRGCFVTLEFGTYRMQDLLTTLIEEHRYQHSLQADQTRNIDHEEVKNLFNFFYPQDTVWKELVLFRASQIVGLAVKGLLQ